VSQSFSYEQIDDELKAFTDRCIEAIQNRNFEGAAKLFHYPSNYSPDELARDRDAVKLGLSELSNAFGTYGESKVVQGSVNSYIFAIGGGNLRYWEKYRESIEVRYVTTFSKEGEGFIIFKVVHISEKLELRSAAFGIPLNAPGARERMEKIGRHMMTILNQNN
jgi:hypothetical protein